MLIWQWIRNWSAVAWACRVSVASVIAAAAIYDLVPQGRDIFADTSRNAHLLEAVVYWFFAFIGIFFVWAVPVHFAARKTLDSCDWLMPAAQRSVLPGVDVAAACKALKDQYAGPILALPRILGFLPFLIIAVSLGYAAWEFREATELPPVEGAVRQLIVLLIVDAIAAALFWYYVVKRQARLHSSARLATVFSVLRYLLIALWLLALFTPDLFSRYFPRAILPPLLFGGATIFFAWLARRSDRTGAPVVLLVIVGVMMATALNTHFHDIRTVAVTGAPEASRRTTFTEAAARWRVANGCEAPKKCPPAVIVAAEGGASRAAFFTATVVGDLFDTKVEGTPDNSYPMINRLFAMSGVSGGSVGAAVIHAAVADWRDDGRWPCTSTRQTWFRESETAGPPSTWRGCLQLLTSGDFLTPVFIGLGFRDNFAPPGLTWGDRGVLLEEAWESHYDFVGRRKEDTDAAVGSRGLHRQIVAESARLRQGAWVPLVFLNSTSVETGRRVIVAETDSAWSPDGKAEAIYPEAFDIFEMMARQCVEVTPGKRPPKCPGGQAKGLAGAPDLTLSTAAIISARFPIISPPGTIRDASYVDTDGTTRGGVSVDRVVDGGVFENAGLTTAREIALALRRAGITPVILHINNDPQLAEPVFVPPRREGAQQPWLEEGGAASFLKRLSGTLGGPVQALYSTRQGHGAEARRLTLDTVQTHGATTGGAPCPVDSCMFEIDVRAQPPVSKANGALCEVASKQLKMDVVSMSWWLSPPVQAFLDVQLCETFNFGQMTNLRAVLTAKP